jgi:hypothetical protein
MSLRQARERDTLENTTEWDRRFRLSTHIRTTQPATQLKAGLTATVPLTAARRCLHRYPCAERNGNTREERGQSHVLWRNRKSPWSSTSMPRTHRRSLRVRLEQPADRRFLRGLEYPIPDPHEDPRGSDGSERSDRLFWLRTGQRSQPALEKIAAETPPAEPSPIHRVK